MRKQSAVLGMSSGCIAPGWGRGAGTIDRVVGVRASPRHPRHRKAPRMLEMTAIMQLDESRSTRAQCGPARQRCTREA